MTTQSLHGKLNEDRESCYMACVAERSRLLEVVGERENGRARERHVYTKV